MVCALAAFPSLRNSEVSGRGAAGKAAVDTACSEVDNSNDWVADQADLCMRSKSVSKEPNQSMHLQHSGCDVVVNFPKPVIQART